MKSSIKTMYKVGKIFNMIAIVLSSLMFFAGMFTLIFKERVAELGIKNIETAGAAERLGIVLLIVAAVSIILEIAFYVCASKADRFTREDKDTYVDHTTMVVIGIIGNIFYLIGGIFGLVYLNQKESEKEIEDKKE